ncbi:MAG TPA: hypothetical protein VF062_03025 [Candidatus Limnocylindrales bacterium]
MLTAIANGRWRPPTGQQTFLDVFGERAGDATFYDVPEMLGQNSKFQGWSPEEQARHGFVGEEGLGITPSLTVLIGDLEHDAPIALDYRLDPAAPRVLYLRRSGWFEVAPNIEMLLQRLGIDWRSYAVMQKIKNLLRLD